MDVVEICDRSKVMRSGSNGDKIKDTFVDISGSRYFNGHRDVSADFTTRLVSSCGVTAGIKEAVKRTQAR